MDLETAVVGAFNRAQLDPGISQPTTISDVARAIGGNGPLAARLTGTTDTHAAPFKAMMKSLQRWERYEGGERGANVRKPGADALARIQAIGKELYDKSGRPALLRDGLHVKFIGDVIVSPKGRRPDERERRIDTHIEGAALADLLNALAAKDATEAADQFNFAMLAAYGMPGSAVVSDVEYLSVARGNA